MMLAARQAIAVEPGSGRRDREGLHTTLARHHPQASDPAGCKYPGQGRSYFGVYCTVYQAGVVRPGDTVEVLGPTIVI